MTAACRSTPAATTEGLGALFATAVRPGVVTAWVAGLLAVFVPWAVVDPDAQGPGAVRVVSVVLAVGLGLLAARVVRRHAVRRVGGVTGDVLGALVEVTTAVVLLVLALGGPPGFEG